MDNLLNIYKKNLFDIGIKTQEELKTPHYKAFLQSNIKQPLPHINPKPFVPFKTFGNPKTLNCDRDSQGDVYFADMSVSVVRPKCLENITKGMLPQKWMGNKIAPIKSKAGFDMDYDWQIPLAEHWIKNNKKK